MRTITLRYVGTCKKCSAALPTGTQAALFNKEILTALGCQGGTVH